jgi:hypothetical protein
MNTYLLPVFLTGEERDFLDEVFTVWCKWTGGDMTPDEERVYGQLDEKLWGR